MRPGGRSDLGGEQTQRPEHERMSAAPRRTPVQKSPYGMCACCRAVPKLVKADVSWEVTGRCTRRSAGVGDQASGERFAEITPGRTSGQQGLAATCKDWRPERKQRVPEA